MSLRSAKRIHKDFKRCRVSGAFFHGDVLKAVGLDVWAAIPFYRLHDMVRLEFLSKERIMKTLAIAVLLATFVWSPVSAGGFDKGYATALEVFRGLAGQEGCGCTVATGLDV